MGWIIIGGGGHASVIADILLSNNQSVEGFTALSVSPPILDRIPYLGTDDIIFKRDSQTIWLANGVGSTEVSDLRQKIFKRFYDKGYSFPPIVSNDAYLSAFATINAGTVIFPGAVVQTGVVIDKNVIINSGAIIDHGCRIGNHVHIAPGATLSGDITVRDRSHIGTGATIIQGVEIGKEVIVAAGAVVTASLKDRKTVIGVPAKEMSFSEVSE